jgi:hypothetical protein
MMARQSLTINTVFQCYSSFKMLATICCDNDKKDNYMAVEERVPTVKWALCRRKRNNTTDARTCTSFSALQGTFEFCQIRRFFPVYERG